MADKDARLPECPEKSRLMDNYTAAIVEFSRVVNTLNSRMGVMYKGDYERLSKAVDEARSLSESAHRELLDHIAEHAC